MREVSLVRAYYVILHNLSGENLEPIRLGLRPSCLFFFFFVFFFFSEGVGNPSPFPTGHLRQFRTALHLSRSLADVVV